MALDQLGVLMIYPTIAGGDTFFWEKSQNPNTNSRLSPGGSVDKLVKDSAGRWKFDDASKARLQIFTKTGFKIPIGGCDNDFSDNIARGYAGKSDDWGSFEATVGVKVTSAPGGNDIDFHFGGPTGEHPGNSSPCCQGSTYKSHLELNRNPMSIYFAKEMYHVNNSNHRPDPFKSLGSFGGAFNHKVVDLEDFPADNPNGGLFYMKYIVLLNQGSNRKFVKLQNYLCPSGNKADPAAWKLVNETIDTGGWGSGGDKCNGDKDQILNWKSGRVRLRLDSDGSNFAFDSISVRAISPDLVTQPPDTSPPPPITSRFFRVVSIKYHLAGFGPQLCGFPSPVGNFTTLMDVTDNNNWDDLHEGRFRIGILVNTAQSLLIGRRVNRATYYLNKIGTPPPGEVTVNIRRGSDDSAVVNLSHVGGALEAVALETTKTAHVFENLNHNYFLAQGDKVSIEYDAATTGNKVRVWENETGPFDGINTCQIYFDSGSPPVAWGSIQTGQDVAAKLEENIA